MTVIRVNGEAIDEPAIQHETAAMLDAMAARMQGDDPLTLRARAREWAEENLIEALLRQAALREPELPPIPAGCSRESEERLRRENLINRITTHAAPPPGTKKSWRIT